MLPKYTFLHGLSSLKIDSDSLACDSFRKRQVSGSKAHNRVFQFSLRRSNVDIKNETLVLVNSENVAYFM